MSAFSGNVIAAFLLDGSEACGPTICARPTLHSWVRCFATIDAVAALVDAGGHIVQRSLFVFLVIVYIQCKCMERYSLGFGQDTLHFAQEPSPSA